MVSSFYIVLPSNTNVEGNRTNSFRVRLPRKLQFNSEWQVGLAVMVYPHSWPSLGTTEDQAVTVLWQTGETIRLPVPSSSLTNPHELRESLLKTLGEGSEQLAQKVRTVQWDYGKLVGGVRERAKAEHQRLVGEARAAGITEIEAASDVQGAEKIKRAQRAAEQAVPSEESIYLYMLNEEIAKLDDETRHTLDATKELGLEPWVHVYRRSKFACRFDFDATKNRFSLFMDQKYVKRVDMTEQLAYILGFDKSSLHEPTEAKFMPDMNGGVSSFQVYAPGLIEPMIIGDVSAPVLRIVTIRGRQDEIVEEQFIAVQYHKILVKEISELQIEIRTSSGSLMPFEYGTCTLTLHFKKAAYF